MTQKKRQYSAKNSRKVAHKTRSAVLKSQKPLRDGKEIDAEQSFLPLLLMLGGLWGARRAGRGAGGRADPGNLGSGGGSGSWFQGRNFGSGMGFPFGSGGFGGFGNGFPFGSGGGRGSQGSGGFSGFGSGFPFGSGGGQGSQGSGGSSGGGGFGGFPFMGNPFGTRESSQGNNPMGGSRWPFFF